LVEQLRVDALLPRAALINQRLPHQHQVRNSRIGAGGIHDSGGSSARSSRSCRSQRLVGDLISMHIKRHYDPHRDLLELRR
jgi:hypothetical protein